jgi:hypothetical protein
MTEQHPLTTAQIKKLVRRYMLDMESGEYSFGEDAVRAVADWQLDQVLIWLNDNLACGNYLRPKGYSHHKIDVNEVLYDLEEAMRPQEDN